MRHMRAAIEYEVRLGCSITARALPLAGDADGNETGRLRFQWGSSQPLAVRLDRRARHGSVGAEYATVERVGFQASAATGAVIENWHALVHWSHCLGRLVLKAVRCPKSVDFIDGPRAAKIGMQLPLPLKELKRFRLHIPATANANGIGKTH